MFHISSLLLLHCETWQCSIYPHYYCCTVGRGSVPYPHFCCCTVKRGSVPYPHFCCCTVRRGSVSYPHYCCCTVGRGSVPYPHFCCCTVGRGSVPYPHYCCCTVRRGSVPYPHFCCCTVRRGKPATSSSNTQTCNVCKVLLNGVRMPYIFVKIIVTDKLTLVNQAWVKVYTLFLFSLRQQP